MHAAMSEPTTRVTRGRTPAGGGTRHRRRTGKILAILAGVLSLAGIAAIWLTYLHFNPTPGEIIRYTERRLIGHPKLEFVALPTLKTWQSMVERPIPDIEFPTLGKGARQSFVAEANQAPARVLAVRTPTELVEALASATAGTTIELQPGRYPVSQKLTTGHAGTGDGPIIVRSKRLGDATLEFNILEGFHVTQPYWVFENLEITGVCTSDSNCEHAFHVVGHASATVIRNNVVHDFNAHIKVNGEGGAWPDEGVIEHNSFTNARPRHTGNPVALLNINSANRWRVNDNLVENFVKDGGNGVSYGVFMKGASSGGRIERNVVICTTRDISQPGVRVGLSFGGGETERTYCRDRRCDFEHKDGVAANNIAAHCNDFGIDVNRSTGIVVTHNTLINTAGIDVRNSPATATVQANLLDGYIRARNEAWVTEEHNLVASLAHYLRSPDTLELDWATKPDVKLVDSIATHDFFNKPRSATSLPGAIGDAGTCCAQ